MKKHCKEARKSVGGKKLRSLSNIDLSINANLQKFCSCGEKRGLQNKKLVVGGQARKWERKNLSIKRKRSEATADFSSDEAVNMISCAYDEHNRNLGHVVKVLFNVNLPPPVKRWPEVEFFLHLPLCFLEVSFLVSPFTIFIACRLSSSDRFKARLSKL